MAGTAQAAHLCASQHVNAVVTRPVSEPSKNLQEQRVGRRLPDRRVVESSDAAYNAVFTSMKRTGARTSLIVDPSNGRIPQLAPEAQKIAAAEREFRLALLQSTETCKTKS